MIEARLSSHASYYHLDRMRMTPSEAAAIYIADECYHARPFESYNVLISSSAFVKHGGCKSVGDNGVLGRESPHSSRMVALIVWRSFMNIGSSYLKFLLIGDIIRVNGYKHRLYLEEGDYHFI